MLQKHARFIAIMMVLMLLASVIVVPIGDSKEKRPWYITLLVTLTGLEDTLSSIERLIGIITQDLEEMENALSDTNDELDELYPKRDAKEKELREEQKKLDELDAEHEAALSKKRNARSRISTLKDEIRQTEAELKNLSPSESSKRAGLESQLAMQKSALASAEQEVKEADKIINSHWRGIKRSWYRYIIGDAFSGLEGELVDIKARINTLETLADNLERDIENKNKEKEDETKRRKGVAEDVKKKRKEYEDAKKNGDPNAQK